MFSLVFVIDGSFILKPQILMTIAREDLLNIQCFKNQFLIEPVEDPFQVELVKPIEPVLCSCKTTLQSNKCTKNE